MVPVAAHVGDEPRTVARADMDPSLAVLRDPQLKHPLIGGRPKIPDLRILQVRVRAGWDDAHGPGLPVLGQTRRPTCCRSGSCNCFRFTRLRSGAVASASGVALEVGGHPLRAQVGAFVDGRRAVLQMEVAGRRVDELRISGTERLKYYVNQD